VRATELETQLMAAEMQLAVAKLEVEVRVVCAFMWLCVVVGVFQLLMPGIPMMKIHLLILL